MGIEKFRRRIAAKGGLQTLAASSIANINVSSQAIIGSAKGNDRWRGITNIASGDALVVVSASMITSGYPILVSLGRATVASHRNLCISVNSVVDGKSCVIVSNLATVASQEVCYIVID